MLKVRYRPADESDISAMARIRAQERESEEYWKPRISGYWNGEHHPRQALRPRIVYVALQRDSLLGFIAGHLTRRYACDGELQWINVARKHRGAGIASELLRCLAGWFGEQEASRICVDVEPENMPARRFYTRHGARELNAHWLVWDDIGVVLQEGWTRKRSTVE